MEMYEVIGIDHGWSNIKTVTGQFVTGVKEMSTEPALKQGLLEYKGKFYKIGGRRQEVIDKTSNESFWLMTLAGIAIELKRRGKCRANVFLSVGLPLATFGKDKKAFVEYLNRPGEHEFKFEGVNYLVTIGKVMISPQCYAAVVDKLTTFPKNPVVVDIGSWTVDILPIENNFPDESQAVTSPNGIITCLRNINAELVRKLGHEVSENEMVDVMLGNDNGLPGSYMSVIKDGFKRYADEIAGILTEHSINTETKPIIFVGGGAVIMKKFGSLSGPNIIYYEDIKENAKGFEYMGRFKCFGKVS